MFRWCVSFCLDGYSVRVVPVMVNSIAEFVARCERMGLLAKFVIDCEAPAAQPDFRHSVALSADRPRELATANHNVNPMRMRSATCGSGVVNSSATSLS